MAEEASERVQAALKLRRALDGTNPTPKSVEECRKAFEEEYADVMVCMAALDFSDVRKAKGLPCDWQTGMGAFRWWMEDDNISGQLSMDDLMEDNDV